jgi:hypothetical protein
VTLVFNLQACHSFIACVPFQHAARTLWRELGTRMEAFIGLWLLWQRILIFRL